MQLTLIEESVLFKDAVAEYTEHPNSGDAICSMMGLALEGRNGTIRLWAAKWLKENCNILVTTKEDQKDSDHAASTKAEGIL